MISRNGGENEIRGKSFVQKIFPVDCITTVILLFFDRIAECTQLSAQRHVVAVGIGK